METQTTIARFLSCGTTLAGFLKIIAHMVSGRESLAQGLIMAQLDSRSTNQCSRQMRIFDFFQREDAAYGLLYSAIQLGGSVPPRCSHGAHGG